MNLTKLPIIGTFKWLDIHLVGTAHYNTRCPGSDFWAANLSQEQPANHVVRHSGWEIHLHWGDEVSLPH